MLNSTSPQPKTKFHPRERRAVRLRNPKTRSSLRSCLARCRRSSLPRRPPRHAARVRRHTSRHRRTPRSTACTRPKRRAAAAKARVRVRALVPLSAPDVMASRRPELLRTGLHIRTLPART